MGHLTAIDEYPVLAEPASYAWSFPGAPIKVFLELEPVKRMQVQFRGANTATRGLLVGGIDGQTTTISGFQPLYNGDAAEIEAAIAALETKPGHSLVGYYRTQREDTLRLNENDLSLARTFFRNPHHVFLLIQAVDSGPANASFFFWDEGRITGDFSFLEFPFDAALLAKTERRRIEATQQKVLNSQAKTGADPRPVSPKRAPSRVAKGAALVFLGASLTIAAVSGVRLLAPSFARLVEHLPAAGVSIPPAQPSAPPEQPSIGFEAARQNGDLRLTWKRESDVVRNATAGVLSIQDGNSRREIQLLAEQVRGGSILYSPVSDQVQMQLTVSTPTATATESVIVINPRVGSPKVQALSSNTVTAQTVHTPPLPAGAPQVASRKTFTPPAVAPRTPGPSAVLDAPPALPANSAPEIRGPASLLSGVLAAAPRPPVQAPPSPNPSPVAAPPAPIYYPPAALRTAMPDFPAALRLLAWKARTVEVSVSIDERGNVMQARALPAKDLQQVMIDSALDAARKWKFRPARRGDVPVPSEMVLRFEFKPRT